ncbi:siderophore ABC transporter substrate-binding protein [Psychromonas sp. SR45-3]|uniref:siderophore ABC transporter substrate-binding protein n=1 Tax=Psychromonas sp. SR45-3 TaxID=2760930 RepID=UPI0015FC8B72|nr:ABC transporter substrate-binding protein [Psychromonas sp. SR45-3]MBB1271309.1 ABC transporter substrate-binding protein [Psychromonas sp. SR45-3]
MTFGKIFFHGLLRVILLVAVTSPAFATTYEHSLGTVEINGVPKRVVILGFGSLDFVDALGVTPIAMPKSLLPITLEKYKADKYVDTGTLQEVNYETLFTLKPDLIIAEGRMAKLYPDLAAIAPTYLFQVEAKHYWESTQKHWLNLSKILGKEEKGAQLIADIQNRIDKIKQKTQRTPLKVLTAMSNGSNITSFSPTSRFSFIYDEAGFMPSTSGNVASKNHTHGNLISFEYIADAQPDVLLILDRDQAIGKASGQAQQLFNNALVNSIPAAKNGRIIYLDTTAWYLAAGGYRSIKQMILDLNNAIR